MATTCMLASGRSFDRSTPLLLFVEGQHDIEFLHSVSSVKAETYQSTFSLASSPVWPRPLWVTACVATTQYS